MLTGCSGKTPLTTPDLSHNKNIDVPGSGLFRGLAWGNDEVIWDDDVDDEKNVDISNVVYDFSYGNNVGLIKKAGLYNEYTYTVAVWQEKEQDETKTVWFMVLYNPGNGKSAPMEVDDSSANVKAAPSVTAFIHRSGDYEYLYISIVYQKLVEGRWQVWHARYRQTAPPPGFGFQPVGQPEAIFEDLYVDYKHPDIVYDYDPYFIGPERLHVVCEQCIGDYEWNIAYKGVNDHVNSVSWDVWLHSIFAGGWNWRPRIDVGCDNTGFLLNAFGLGSPYYIGVVWQLVRLIPEGNTVDVMYTGLPSAGAVLVPHAIWLTRADPNEYNVFPNIEIEPIENAGHIRTTFVVWAKAIYDPQQNDYPTAEMHSLNTFQMKVAWPDWGPSWPPPPTQLFIGDPPGGRNAFPTFAIKAAGSTTGNLAWLHDEGMGSTYVPVWGGDVNWTPQFIPDNTVSLNPEPISSGSSSYEPAYIFGPEIAIFNYANAKCIWTDKELINGGPPPVYDFGIHGNTNP